MLLYDGVCATARPAPPPYGTGSDAQIQLVSDHLTLEEWQPAPLNRLINRAQSRSTQDLCCPRASGRGRKWSVQPSRLVTMSHPPIMLTSDVAPSGLVCRLILTIAVKLFQYFSKCWLINDLFIHLCCDISVGLFIVPSIYYLYYLKILPRDFKRSPRERAFPLRCWTKRKYFKISTMNSFIYFIYLKTGMFLSANIL